MKRDFVLVLISLVAWGIGEAAFFYFQPLYLEELGASPLEIGGILGAMGLAMTVVHIPAGYLADRLGRRELMWAAWITGIVTTAIMAAARSLPVFTVGIILYSSTVFVIAPLNSYATAARHKLTVEQAMTTTTAGFYLGGIVGPLIGGTLASRFGLRSIYFFSFFVFLASAVIILFINPQPTEKAQPQAVGRLLRNHAFRSYLPFILLVYLALFLPQPLAPNFLQNQRGISVGTIGFLAAMTNIGNVVLNLAFGLLPAQTGVILGQLFVGVFTALVWKTARLPFLTAAYFLLGGFRATRSLLTARIEKLVTSDNLGLAYGISESVCGLAMAAAPPIAGALYAWAPESMFQVGVFVILGVLVLTLLRRKTIWKP